MKKILFVSQTPQCVPNACYIQQVNLENKLANQNLILFSILSKFVMPIGFCFNMVMSYRCFASISFYTMVFVLILHMNDQPFNRCSCKNTVALINLKYFNIEYYKMNG